MVDARTRFRGLPLCNGLLDFMDAHADFLDALKLSKPEKFEVIPIVMLSRPPDGAPRCDDGVLGLWYLNKEKPTKSAKPGKRPEPWFKQDFIVDVGRTESNYVAYVATQFLRAPSAYLRPIGEFFNDYGDGKRYYRKEDGETWEHHYLDVPDLPSPVRAAGAAYRQRFLDGLKGRAEHAA